MALVRWLGFVGVIRQKSCRGYCQRGTPSLVFISPFDTNLKKCKKFVIITIITIFASRTCFINSLTLYIMVISFIIPGQNDVKDFKIFRHRKFSAAVDFWKKRCPNAWVRFNSSECPQDVDLFFHSDGSYWCFKEFVRQYCKFKGLS